MGWSRECRLKLSCEVATNLGPSSVKRKKLSVEPSAQQERIEALQQVCVCGYVCVYVCVLSFRKSAAGKSH